MAPELESTADSLGYGDAPASTLADPRRGSEARPDPERPEPDSSTGLARDSDSSILKTSGSIALATLISRITGFVRTVLVLAMLGPAIASAFQAAYVLPNMIAEVVLGAVLTAIVIPVLVRSEAEDADGGKAFINRIFTLTVVLLGAATVIALIAAPLLTYLNVGDGKVDRPLTTALAYLLLPEILFYGLSALFIAILNMKGLFKPGAWAPVLNNIVQITTLVLYALMPGEITINPVRMTDPQLLVLGVGTTLGVVLQATILIPYLKKAGVRLRLQWGLDDRLRRFGNMALAIVLYVAILQVGLVITYRIASSASDAGISVYATHWQLLQLPYGVLGVTILTAIMPRLSRNAAAENDKAVVDDMSMATRLTMVALVPVVAFMTFFGPAIAVAVFNFGKFNAETASQLGSVLAWGAFTLIPYAMTLVQLRVFYAREDAWTPTVMVLGITVVKVAASYLGLVLFDDPEMVVRWLALSNGLGYLVGAIVGHYLLRNKLNNSRMAGAARTTVLTLVVSVGMAFVVWFVANLSGLHNLTTEFGKIGSLAYLALTAVVTLGVVYAALAYLRIPDVVAIFDSVQRLLGRFIPALAPPPDAAADPTDPGGSGRDRDRPQTTITVQFPRIGDADSLPYSGQVEVVRRFDRGSASWQSYSVPSGGAAGSRGSFAADRVVVPSDTRYRRRGFVQVGETDVDATHGDADNSPVSKSSGPDASGSDPSGQPPTESAPDARASAGIPRGPRLIPGAAVAGGRYRLLDHHGGSRGLQFWRAQDINLDREVALTFVDADQLTPLPERGTAVRPSDTGPQAVLTRTLRLGQVSSPGVARVLDVVRGSSGGIVVAEWVPGSSLAEVARSEPSPIGAARAVRALAAAAEATHRSGGALSIDHPDRIRISSDGNAVLAFPGTIAGDDKASDVRGLGAVLYALLLARWALDAETGSKVVTSRSAREYVGGLGVASPGKGDQPIEPRDADPTVPFEISAVASRALDGNRGIRTAATVQHVLDQATVVDLPTDMLPTIGSDEAPVSIAAPRVGSDPDGTRNRKHNMALFIGGGLFTLFVVVALIAWATNIFGGSDDNPDIDSILPQTTSIAAEEAPAAAPPPAPISLRSVRVIDFSSQPADDATNVANVISGAAPAWRTAVYRGSPEFGGLKPGLGLIFNLGDPASVRSVTIRTPTPGFDVQLRAATTANPSDLDDTVEVGAATLDSEETTISIENPRDAGYLIVWMTSLPEGSGGYQAQIARVSMEG